VNKFSIRLSRSKYQSHITSASFMTSLEMLKF